jgi:general secretion pathway protein D
MAVLVLWMFLCPWAASPVRAQSGAAEPVTLNFVAAEIEAVARTMATITGRNVVVDPRVKGTVNLATEGPVTPTAALNQFAAALRLQGFSLLDTGGLYKIVPEADARLQGNVVSVGEASAPVPSNTVVTQIFRLNHEPANNLVPVLRPLVGQSNPISVNAGSNALVITDYADNLKRIGQLISALDVAGATDVEIIPVKHVSASDLVNLVARLGEPAGGPGGGGSSDKMTLLAEPRSNSLVLRAANPERLALMRSLVARLDRPASTSAAGNIYVVYLKNADAAAMATTLRAAMASETALLSRPGGSIAPGIGAPGGGGAAPNGSSIQADRGTNSLIITASEPQYRQLRAVIDKLDARRAQVQVESLIAEVNAEKAAEFGIQWQGALGKAGDTLIGLLGTNFGGGGENIINLARGEALPSPGLNAGIANRTNGIYVLGFLARALQSNGDGNILSTPSLLTLDNEEAKIVIGQNVPFVTGQFSNSGGGNSGGANPFQTIERKDVGLTLRVKPQISENGTIKMTIFQEVSSVQPSSINSSTGLITNLRTIESTVLVDDGDIVVLGGLLQDEYAGNQEKVPGLGDVPLLGNLFKNEKRSRKKTNLMVFLRPVVMRDSNETSSFALDRYELMRSNQASAQPAESSVLGINAAPVLPQRLPLLLTPQLR